MDLCLMPTWKAVERTNKRQVDGMGKDEVEKPVRQTEGGSEGGNGRAQKVREDLNPVLRDVFCGGELAFIALACSSTSPDTV